MVHGAVLVVRGKTYSVLTWSKDKSKKTAMMATILHQFFAEHADVLVGVKVMHIWADNASTYHQADLLGHMCEEWQKVYGFRITLNFGPPGENKNVRQMASAWLIIILITHYSGAQAASELCHHAGELHL